MIKLVAILLIIVYFTNSSLNNHSFCINHTNNSPLFSRFNFRQNAEFNLSLVSCNGLSVGSSYFFINPNKDQISIEMVTFYNYATHTPFHHSRVKCSIKHQKGNYLINGSSIETVSIFRSGCKFKRSALFQAQKVNVLLISSEKVICEIPTNKYFVPSKKYRASVISVVRNVDQSIIEFVNYNLMIGFDHIYLFDDCSNDNTKLVLQPFLYYGLVTYTNWCHLRNSSARQFMAMEDYVIRFKQASDFTVGMDNDCFFISRKSKNQLKLDVVDELISFFVKDKTLGLMYVNGIWFGHSNLTKATTNFVTQTFFWREKLRDIHHIKWPWIKLGIGQTQLAIVRNSMLNHAKRSSHSWNHEGTVKHARVLSLAYNHYKVKSLEEFINKSVFGGWHASVGGISDWKRMGSMLNVEKDISMKSLVVPLEEMTYHIEILRKCSQLAL